VIVDVDLGDHGYDVVIDDGARRGLRQLLDNRAPKARLVALVTSDSLVQQTWFDLESGHEQFVVTVPDGESAKTLSALERLLETLTARRVSREDVVVGVGGGAITDLAGFAAAVYLRGVPVIHVPTTIVGQADAAIGGKTGVNLGEGKNLVGAFHQPLGVLCDTSVLATLPERERRSGLGEVAKCWLLEGRGTDGLAQSSLATLITMAAQLKASIVSSDERESGDRVLLNYGHTLAHAIETLARERGDDVRHGEAVAVGLAFAARLARELDRVDENEVTRHDEVLNALGLEWSLNPGYGTAELISAMEHDKKAHHDLSFVLPGREGFALEAGVDPSVVARVLERFKGES
jgi:5-deoxy-5-amino-3-dehydroquinate synthase